MLQKRTYDGCDLIGCASALTRIAKVKVDPKDPSFNKGYKKRLTFGLTLSLMEMPSCRFGDYMNISLMHMQHVHN
jgi:hypothetical protein